MSKLKKLFLIVFLSVFIGACSNSKKTSIRSLENQAKTLTDNMVQTLSLNNEQKELVFTINLVRMSLKEKLKEAGDIEIKYTSEMKRVLSDQQFKLFEENYLKLN